MQNDMQGQIKEGMKQELNRFASAGMPQNIIDRILSNIPNPGENADVKISTIYKPEYSWNYEIGTHLSLFNNKLQADIAAFYMDTHDQQIARFSENGYGRMTVNAGRSRSIGAEVALRANITNAFSLNASYGYTHATFRNYISNQKNGNKLDTINLKGNFVPMAPRHTLCVGGEYVFRFSNPTFNQLAINLYYTAAGKIYWTEQNDISQSFYGTLNARISAKLKDVQIDLWGRNLTDKQYTAFYFESMSKSFMQKGKPLQLGIDLRYKF